ncbi:hypothetical protein V8G54_035712, partial [Vigna mungo]
SSEVTTAIDAAPRSSPHGYAHRIVIGFRNKNRGVKTRVIVRVYDLTRDFNNIASGAPLHTKRFFDMHLLLLILDGVFDIWNNASQQIISIFCPKSSLAPSIPMVKQSFSLNFAPLHSLSSYPFLQSQNLGFPAGALHAVSFVHKEVCSSSWRIRSSKSSNTAELEEDHEVRAQVTVRRKKLAVFVSGGG